MLRSEDLVRIDAYVVRRAVYGYKCTACLYQCMHAWVSPRARTYAWEGRHVYMCVDVCGLMSACAYVSMYAWA